MAFQSHSVVVYGDVTGNKESDTDPAAVKDTVYDTSYGLLSEGSMTWEVNAMESTRCFNVDDEIVFLPQENDKPDVIFVVQ